MTRRLPPFAAFAELKGRQPVATASAGRPALTAEQRKIVADSRAVRAARREARRAEAARQADPTADISDAALANFAAGFGLTKEALRAPMGATSISPAAAGSTGAGSSDPTASRSDKSSSTDSSDRAATKDELLRLGFSEGEINGGGPR